MQGIEQSCMRKIIGQLTFKGKKRAVAAIDDSAGCATASIIHMIFFYLASALTSGDQLV